jgi:uroporphyrinogen-III synthase
MTASAQSPLAGRRIAVTRSSAQAQELTSRLAALGAQVLSVPLLEFALPEDTTALDNALQNIEQFDWIFFTSRNAVSFVARRAEQLGVALSQMLARGRPRLAAVGSATASAIEEQGWPVAYTGRGAGALALVAELAPQLRGCRVLLPRSHRAPSDVDEALRAAGAIPVAVVAYRTLEGEPDTTALAEVLEGRCDMVTFFSPSAFHFFLERVGPDALRALCRQMYLAAIGPTTARAIREAGFPVAVEAGNPSVHDLCEGIVRFFSERADPREEE